jgi:hypothetical protein
LRTPDNKPDNHKLGKQTEGLSHCTDHTVPRREYADQNEQDDNRTYGIGRLGAKHRFGLSAQQNQTIAEVEKR